MLSSNHVAFKEWAAVCAALAEGRQTLILRKGGIHEGREGFRVAHPEFWLFPTYVHEAVDGLVGDAQQLLEAARRTQPATGTVRIAQYAVVSDVFELQAELPLVRLAGQHVWSAQTIADRFHYRRPGLFLLVARIYTRDVPHVIPDSPHLAGCRTWVDLPESLSTDDLRPALDDAQFAALRERVAAAVAPPVVV